MNFSNKIAQLRAELKEATKDMARGEKSRLLAIVNTQLETAELYAAKAESIE